MDLFDIFEPNYLEPAFTKKDIVLAHLIFGVNQAQKFGFTLSGLENDPLTEMFKARGNIIMCVILDLL